MSNQLAEAFLIPGSTQVFADVLEGTGERGSGSVQKLLANMKKGKYDLQDIVKVLDSLESRIDKDLLEKMFNRPAAAMADLQNSMTRFWTTINDEGGLDLQTSILGGLAKAINDLTKWLKEHEAGIARWSVRIKAVTSLLWDLTPALLSVYMTLKLISALKWLGVLGGAALPLRAMLGRLLGGGAISMAVLARTLFGARAAGVFSGGILNFLKTSLLGGLRLFKLSLPFLIAGVALDLVETLNGKFTLLSQGASSDNWLIRIFSKSVIAWGEWVKNLSITAIGLYDLVLGNINISEFSDLMKHFWGEFGRASKLSQETDTNWTDTLFSEFGIFFDWIFQSVTQVGLAFGALRAGDFGKAMSLSSEFAKNTKDSFMMTAGGSQTGEAMMAFRAKNNLANELRNNPIPSDMSGFPVAYGANGVPVMASSRAQQNTSATTTIISPTISLTLQPSGTVEDMAKIATQQFTDMFTTGIMNTMVNYQAGSK